MDDSAVYLLLKAIVEKAKDDAKTPHIKCVYPPFNHTYWQCANGLILELRELTQRTSASEMGLEILRDRF